MPTIAIVDGVVLMMFVNDHPPAHVHAKLAEHRCKISIVTGEVISGTLPSSKLKVVQSWLKHIAKKLRLHGMNFGTAVQSME